MQNLLLPLVSIGQILMTGEFRRDIAPNFSSGDAIIFPINENK